MGKVEKLLQLKQGMASKTEFNLLKKSLWKNMVIYIIIIVIFIPSSVFALDKNYRQAGLIDDMTSKRFMKEYENITFTKEGIKAEDGKTAIIEYQLADEFSYGNIYYQGTSENISVSVSKKGDKYKDVVFTDNGGYINIENKKSEMHIIRISLKGDTVINYVELNTTRDAGNGSTSASVITLPEESLTDIMKKNGMYNVHPRVLGTEKNFERILSNLSEEPFKTFYNTVSKEANNLLDKDCVQYVASADGLLEPAREVKRRIECCSMMWRLTKDSKYGERAWKEIENAISFPNIYPEDSGLVISELLFAYGLGYDWLYDFLNADRETVLREEMIKRLKFMEGGIGVNVNWGFLTNNIHSVVRGGTAVAATAIIEKEPELAENLIRKCVSELPVSMKMVAPEGVYPEGPSYWDYGTVYTIHCMSTIEAAFGTDFGLSKVKGYDKTGEFPLFISSSAGYAFNFGDSGSYSPGGAQLYWMAEKYNCPLYSWYQRRINGAGGVFDLMWYNPEYDINPDKIDVPLDAVKRGEQNFAAFRSSWTDSNGLYAAIKGGYNQTTHGDLDIGSFVIDALGKRWLLDYGYEKYSNPGIFERNTNGKRWTYYGKRAEAHNTLVMNPSNGPDQDVFASCDIDEFFASGGGGYAVVDMTPAYKKYAKSVVRGMMVFDRKRQVMIRDEIIGKDSPKVWWQIHTPANITLSEDKKSAILEIDREKMMVTIKTPVDAKFEIRDSAPLPGAPTSALSIDRTKDSKTLAINLKNVKETAITVIFSPYWGGELDEDRYVPEIKPIEEWEVKEEKYASVDEILVDGQPLSDFNPERFTYTIELPRKSTHKPIITAKSDQYKIETNQEDSVIGRTVIRAEGAGVLPGKYIVNTVYEKLSQIPEGTEEYIPVSWKASGEQEGNEAEHCTDGNLDTKWAVEGTDQYITFDLGSTKSIRALGVAFPMGNSRNDYFAVGVSEDGSNFEEVYNGGSDGSTTALVPYEFVDTVQARYVRMYVKGNSTNNWNSISEVKIYGDF